MGFDPLTIAAAASIGSAVVGTGLQMAGQYQASQAAQSQAAYNAAIMENNRRYAMAQRDQALRAGEDEIGKQQREAGRLRAKQIAQYAAAGIDVGQGSPVDVALATRDEQGRDEVRLRENISNAAWGFEREAAGFATQADIYRLEGRQARASIPLQLLSTGASGAGTVASKWYNFRTGGSVI